MERDKYWDSLKFVLIFFVVYGHMIETFASDGSYNRAMYNFIYTFHMGFFLFISGRFSQLKDRKKYRKGIIKLCETYIVFQLIRCLKVLAMGNTLYFFNDVIYPKGTMWYIACLIIYRLFIYFIPQEIRRNQWVVIVIVSYILALCWGFIPIPISHRLLAFFPYFLFGYYSVKLDVKSCAQKIPIYAAFLGVIFFLALIYMLINFDICYVLYCDRSYFWNYAQIPPFNLFIARSILYVSAAIISFFFMRIALDYEVFPQLGKKTLFIYMYHTFIILALRYLITNGYLPNNEFVLIGYTISIIVFLIVLSKVSFFVILMNPVSYFVKKKDKRI